MKGSRDINQCRADGCLFVRHGGFLWHLLLKSANSHESGVGRIYPEPQRVRESDAIFLIFFKEICLPILLVFDGLFAPTV